MHEKGPVVHFEIYAGPSEREESFGGKSGEEQATQEGRAESPGIGFHEPRQAAGRRGKGRPRASGEQSLSSEFDKSPGESLASCILTTGKKPKLSLRSRGERSRHGFSGTGASEDVESVESKRREGQAM